jgi:iron complex transport system substrate-binding protein
VGDHIVATVQHSDYPEAARHIPRLGDAFSLGIEAVIGLSPDLILAWTTGGNARTVRRLQELGYSIYLNEARNLDAIAGNVERIGILVGEAQKGALLADGFRQSLSALRESKLTQERRSVFFQIADTQLYTVNDQHLIGQAITACGGGNIFGDLELMVPLVSLESIVEADPAIILVASPHKDFVSRWQDDWKRLGWQARIRYIDASLITRPSLRMLNGIKSLCKLL